MRILAASVFVAGLAIGIGWNGHGTQSLGLYLLVIVGAWCLISFVILGAWVGALEFFRGRARRRETFRVVRRTRPAPTTPASPQAVARDYSHSERPGHAEPNQSGPPAA